jgi:uncharacterized protein (TIGR03435 family)
MTGRTLALAFLSVTLHAQSFDAASVKPSAKSVGPDYNNQIVIGPSAFSAKNITLKGLIVEAYGLAPTQVFAGPKWLDQSEFDVEAKAGHAVSRDELRKMLQPLLAERFHLAIHRETREMKSYDLVVDKGGAKIQPVKDGEGTPAPLGSRHFHGELDQLASLIAIKLTMPPASDDPSRPTFASGTPVPVLNKTGLTGTYDFDIELKIEPGIPSFNLWQSVLQGQLGLRLDARKGPVEGIVVDSADRVPVEN